MTLTVQDLLDSLGLDAEGRLAFYERQVGYFDDQELRRRAGADYRQRKSRLRRILGSSRIDGIDPSIEWILSSRREALAVAARQLADLAESHDLTTSVENLYASYVHMHVNRLVGVSSPLTEGHVLQLLSRAQKSLVLAPGP